MIPRIWGTLELLAVLPGRLANLAWQPAKRADAAADSGGATVLVRIALADFEIFSDVTGACSIRAMLLCCVLCLRVVKLGYYTQQTKKRDDLRAVPFRIDGQFERLLI